VLSYIEDAFEARTPVEVIFSAPFMAVSAPQLRVPEADLER
jgi:hypothetical protein